MMIQMLANSPTTLYLYILYSHNNWYIVNQSYTPVTADLTEDEMFSLVASMSELLLLEEGEVAFVPTKEYPIPE